jgi:hypothetical protein
MVALCNADATRHGVRAAAKGETPSRSERSQEFFC